MDRSLTPYLVLAVIAGGLPLIFYFGITRKSAKGWLMGLGACAGLFVVVVILSTILSLIGRAL